MVKKKKAKEKEKRLEEKQEISLKEGISPKVKKKINCWMITTVVLAMILLICGIIELTSGISRDSAEAKFLEFAQSQGAEVEVLTIESVGSLYEITFTFMNQEGRFHITKDGRYLGQMTLLEGQENLTAGTRRVSPQQGSQQAPPGYSAEDLARLRGFNECLATKGVKVYGANWCGWTIRLIDTMGGANTIAPIYVECTTNEALCAQEGIQGYPTIRINGQEYRGARTIEALAQATGCSAPILTSGVASSNSPSNSPTTNSPTPTC